MALTDIISDLAGALAESRDKLAGIVRQISDLQGRRAEVLAAPPHSDDIVAAFMRGLDAATVSFESRLGRHLNDANARSPQAAKEVLKDGQLLMVGSKVEQSAVTSSHSLPTGLLPPSGLGDHQSALDVAAVTYFLRDRIEAEIPALVNKLCPSARNGMKRADREQSLRELDAEIARLSSERNELMGNIEAARRAAILPQ